MKLSYRLALPLAGAAVVITGAAAVGMTLLVSKTVDTAFRQSSAQLARITENAMRTRAEALQEVAFVFASLRGDVRSRSLRWKHPVLDAVAVVDARTGKIRSGMGKDFGGDDLRALVSSGPPPLPVMRIGKDLAIAGAAYSEDRNEMVVVGKCIDREFARELKGLLQADIEIRSGGRTVAASAEGGPPRENLYRAESRFVTPGGGEMNVVMILPVDELVSARRKALAYALGGGVLLLLLAFLFYAYAVVRVTRPLRELIEGVRRATRGDLDPKLTPGAPDELGELMSEFNRMAKSLKQAQERLVHSAKLSSVGRLIAGISHELNNPLSGLLGHAEHLLSKHPSGDPAGEKLETIVREGKRMKKILADLMGLTRPNSRERKPFDLNQVAGEVVALVRHDAEGAGVACGAVLEPGGTATTGSSDEMRQVLLNLVLNAIEATSGGGRIEVATFRLHDNGRASVGVAVSDTGEGIPADAVGKITEPFFSTKPGRIGMGLAISREIVETHGGTMRFESNEGKGTRVVVELPAMVAP